MLFSFKYYVISAWCLPRFFLFFSFQKFNYDVSWISLGFSFLRFTQLLKSVVLFCARFGKFSAIMSLSIFSVSLSFGTPITRMSFCCDSQIPEETFFSFHSIFCVSFYILSKFYGPSLMSIDSVVCHSHSD